MKALVLVFSMLLATGAAAQAQRSELDKAYEEARAALQALKQAEARRDEGIAVQEGDRQGTARRRYEAALKRWNDLK